MKLQLYGPPEVPGEVWRQAAPLLEKALEPRHGLTLDGLIGEVMRGDVQLWLLHDDSIAHAAFITSCRVRHSGKAFAVNVAGGELVLDCLELIDHTFTEYAKMVGCGWIEVVGRRGWQGALRTRGFHHAYTAVTREIES